MLENYIAFKEELSSTYIKQQEQSGIIFKRLKRVPKEIRNIFKNQVVYKVHIPNNAVNIFWNVIRDKIKEEVVVEIYSCTKDDKGLIESIIINKQCSEKPELKNGTYIALGEFVRGREIEKGEKLLSNNKYLYVLSVFRGEKHLYIDIITKLKDSELAQSTLKNISKRENKLNHIKEKHKWINKVRKVDDNLIPLTRVVEEVKINNYNHMRFSQNYYYYDKGRACIGDVFETMLLRYYESQDRIPKHYKGEDCRIQRMEFKNIPIDEKIEKIEFKLGEAQIEYEIQKSVQFKIGQDEEFKTVEYINPYDNKKYEVHINYLEKMSNSISKEIRKALGQYMGSMEKSLILFYENPNENISPNFYLKNDLDSKEYNNLGFDVCMTVDKEAEYGKNGYKLMTEKLYGFKGHTEEVEIELFSITNNIRRKPIEFIEGKTNKKPLKDCVIYKGESENDTYEKIHKNYKHIRFTPEKLTYCKGEYATYENYVAHEKINIPMGKSRIGGPVVDLPEGVEYPKDFYFAAQLNLEEFNEYYINEYLPQTGFLYFFTDYYSDYGQVIYSNCKKEDLKRVIKEHGDSFYSGNLIKDIYVDEENINERYYKEHESDKELEWDYFSGTEKSKLFGIYTNCQCVEEEVIDEMLNDDLVLLQVGEDFTECGVFTVRIPKKDLERLDFSNCSFEWSQS